ncbi:SPOR domain-containing protein [Aminipila butyrica]|uniref:SPOR domain-containing protein n=1 Tax=Aminipila butyrica TaxID=433296 RepID=A0A858BWK0_9FIRM|nr:SPOR domain-containing protein [Aminipila butyrica]QIB69280.1 SPOR domain-containing protein [Aminipila butyrica]
MRPIRRKRRRNGFRQKTKVNFTAIIVIISMAVLLGYGTAKFIIYPLFHDSGQKGDDLAGQGFQIEKFLSFFLKEDDPQKEPEGDKNGEQGVQEQGTSGPAVQPDSSGGKDGVVEDKLNVTPVQQSTGTDTTNGYCIQFGSFTTKLSAESLVSELKASGITAEIIEKDGAYKVVSQLFQQKEEAVTTMNSLVGTKYADAFITPR